MKQIVILILFATLFVACNNDAHDEDTVMPDLTQIGIKAKPAEKLQYEGRIGSNFDTALDSLRKLKAIHSEIIKEPLEVLFDYDDRMFFGIVYGDCAMYSDVLDTKGYYYHRSWYSPEEGNKADMQEEPIFKENQTFTIGNGCSSIMYLGKIGYDFESALDSLTKIYKPMLNTLAQEGHYSGKGYNIDKKEMNVDFDYDSRKFILLTFSDKTNIYQILFSHDVIDEKGNYFRLVEGDD